MFFSPELLQKRESGLGLLWLAATLGPKANFKRLQKRSILTANISKLCGLVAEPLEPFSLRLSSNLMIGVVRVYRGANDPSSSAVSIPTSVTVKNDLLFTDVATCVASLKRALSGVRISSTESIEMPMANLMLGPEALGVSRDGALDFELEFGLTQGMMFSHDDSRTDDCEEGQTEDVIQSGAASFQRHKSPQLHLLDESTERSFLNQTGADFSISSDLDDFGFGNSFFAFDDAPAEAGDPVLGDLSAELARSAGGSWVASMDPPQQIYPVHSQAPGADRMTKDSPFDVENGMQRLGEAIDPASYVYTHDTEKARGNKRPFRDVDTEEYLSPLESPPLAIIPTPLPLAVVNGNHGHQYLGEPVGLQRKRLKRIHCNSRVDGHTQLNDEGMKASRNDYVKEQNKLRNDLARRQRHATAAITAVKEILACPRGFGAPQLQALWKERFKTLSLCNEGYSVLEEQVIAGRRHDGIWTGSLPLAPQQREGGVQIDVGLGGNQNDTIGNADIVGNLRKTPESNSGVALEATHDFAFDIPTSSDPGMGRGLESSRPTSRMGLLDAGAADVESRESVLAPWDISLPNSPGALFFDKEPGRLSFGGGDPALSDEFLPGAQLGSVASLVQQSNVNRSKSINSLKRTDSLNIEAQSLKFLDYLRSSFHLLEPGNDLGLSAIVPIGSSRRIAAEAFSHCLVLASKGMVALKQNEPHSTIYIRRLV